MKIKELSKCICTPEKGKDDGITGLPVIGLYIEGGELYFSACCPKCGRGNRYDGKETLDDALKAWNSMQKRLREQIPAGTIRKIRNGYGIDQDE